ncbi:hypothetical protein HGM15179_010789 [Zosterops borbonicus]|uniref:Uncharacterized protein n=1 Tax=Zosterops borbonicus TaxID=364589 RepID=A0A8K1GCU6_9PASS|nr:hypothetical protein HGM15179_010789 [Zosterops borbonicus]
MENKAIFRAFKKWERFEKRVFRYVSTMVLVWWVTAHGNSPAEFDRIGHVNMVTSQCLSGKNPSPSCFGKDTATPQCLKEETKANLFMWTDMDQDHPASILSPQVQRGDKKDGCIGFWAT